MSPGELTLDEMLSDVIVQLVMRRDRVTEREIRELMAGLARRRAAGPDQALDRAA
jgi:hypothetical protein